MSLERVSVGEEGEVIPCRWAEKAREPTEERLVRGTLCVKLKTVTEIRRSSASDTVIAESVHLVLNVGL